MYTELVETYLEPLRKKANAEGLSSLSHQDQLILMARCALAYIENGGFEYFYECFVDAYLVKEAFERLGFPEAAQAVAETLKIFPDSTTPTDQDERIRILDQYDNLYGDLTERWRQYDETIWNISWEELDRRIFEIFLNLNPCSDCVN